MHRLSCFSSISFEVCVIKRLYDLRMGEECNIKKKKSFDVLSHVDCCIPDEASVFALPPGVRALWEEQLRSVEDVHQDRQLGLHEGLEVVLQHRDNVLESLDNGPIVSHANLTKRGRENMSHNCHDVKT